ncbi:MAG: hypothetical protein HC830_03420 [Bacteroidetes bacterium]|nr:hypothetical protein [Bacteroidota bacterium]
MKIFVSPEEDSTTLNAGKRFLSNFATETKAFRLRLNIVTLGKEIAGIQNALETLMNQEREIIRNLEVSQLNFQDNKLAQEDLRKKLAEKEVKLLILQSELNNIEQ